MKQPKIQKGFTLIELLVVIAIIGVLSSVVLASLSTARAKSRDALRKESMKSLETALALYYSDFGAYPSTGGGGSWRSACATYGNYPTSGANGYIPGLAPTYISSLPTDPTGCGAGDASYLYTSDGVNYKLLSHRSPESFPSAGNAFYDPQRPTWAWKLCSGEPACSGW